MAGISSEDKLAFMVAWTEGALKETRADSAFRMSFGQDPRFCCWDEQSQQRLEARLEYHFHHIGYSRMRVVDR